MRSTDVLFFIQFHSSGSSSRGIRSGGVIMTLSDLLDKEYFVSVIESTKWSLSYQRGRNKLLSIKLMSLEEYKTIFNGVSFEDISHLRDRQNNLVFRKEVVDYINPRKVVFSTKYNVGNIITGIDGVEYVYLGKYAVEVVDKNGNRQYSGHLYMPRVDYDNNKSVDLPFILKEWLSSIDWDIFNKYILKGKKKAIQVEVNDNPEFSAYLASSDGDSFKYERCASLLDSSKGMVSVSYYK